MIYDLHCELEDGSKIIVEMQNRYQDYFADRAIYYLAADLYLFSDRMRMTFLKIPMLDKDAEECETTLERWLYILKNMEKMEAIPQTFMKEPVFRNLGRIARYAALSENDKKAYKDSLKAYRDAYATDMASRRQGKAEGLAEGRAEGRAEGLAEGMEKGLAEGIEKGLAKGMEKERIESFRNMIAFGISPLQIAQKYSMTEEEVLRLVNS